MTLCLCEGISKHIQTFVRIFAFLSLSLVSIQKSSALVAYNRIWTHILWYHIFVNARVAKVNWKNTQYDINRFCQVFIHKFLCHIYLIHNTFSKTLNFRFLKWKLFWHIPWYVGESFHFNMVESEEKKTTPCEAKCKPKSVFMILLLMSFSQFQTGPEKPKRMDEALFINV